jgi:hypothetical protein
VPQA